MKIGSIPILVTNLEVDMKNLILVVIMMLLSVAAYASDYYVSPAGVPTNTGTLNSPWDLQTGLNNPAVNNNTLCMLGGDYYGKYSSALSNATVKSCLGQWAKIDGNYSTTITAPMTASQNTVSVAGTYIFRSSVVLTINDAEDVQIANYLGNGTYSINRGWNGTTATAHVSGESGRLRGNALEIYGSNTTYRDFEVLDSYPVRAFYNNVGYGGSLRGGEGIFLFGADIKLINLVLHDNADGLFCAESATNTEVYGLIIFNNGHAATDRTHGHGMYVQNVEPSYKNFTDIISFNNFQLGMKAYGANQGHSSGVHFDGIISFGNGSTGRYAGSPSPEVQGSESGNLLIGSDVFPSTNVSVTNSWLYHKPFTEAQESGLALGRAPTGGNTNAVVTGNYINEGYGALLSLNQWTNVTATNNTIVMNSPNWVSNTNQVGIQIDRGDYTTDNFDNNHYYFPYAGVNCVGGTFKAPFVIAPITGVCGSFLRWTDWKTVSGFDINSTYTESLPLVSTVTVRPNLYEAGRAIIIANNWQSLTSINVDLSLTGLTNGKHFEVRNVENYLGAPIYTGIFNSGSPNITLPTTGMQVATPIGNPFTPTSTCPQFCVYVVVPIPNPTAAAVSLSGQAVFGGGGVSNATILLTSSNGLVYQTTSSSFGYFTITNIPAGGTYVLDGRKKGIVFIPQLLNLTGPTNGVILQGN